MGGILVGWHDALCPDYPWMGEQRCEHCYLLLKDGLVSSIILYGTL